MSGQSDPAARSLQQPHKTHAWSDLEEPIVAEACSELTRFFRRQFVLRGTKLAVNGVHRFRWRIRPLKMWEYARGWAAAPVTAGHHLLDFGGGGTLIPCFAAARGAQVDILDIDAPLLQTSADLARRRAWPIRTSTANLAQADAPWPAGWPVGAYHAIHSYCVLEHIDYSGQEWALRHLAQALRPGGRMVLTFEYGAEAPGEAPWRDLAHLNRMVELLAAHGVQLVEPREFVDSGLREALDRRHPQAPFAFGMLVGERLS